MLYSHDISGCFDGALNEHGLSEDDVSPLMEGCQRALVRLAEQQADGSLPLLRLPGRRDDLEVLRPVAADLHSRLDVVAVLGTGGSSLGGQTLCALTDLGFGPRAGTPKLVFLDNVDPDAFNELLGSVRLNRLGLLVISKSGGTAETLTQFLSLVPRMVEAVGIDGLRQHVVVITEPGANPLRTLAKTWDLPVLDHDPGVGGRFSALSVTGMLPSLIAGVDCNGVRDGAAAVLDAALSATAPDEVPAAMGAAVSVALLKTKKIGTTVLMPYLDRLASFGLWYRQLWAESLGKDGTGTTPIRAMGTVDQHSQLQLYLAGPRDKMFTVLTGVVAGTGNAVPPELADIGRLDYLSGRTMGDLLDAEQRATADTLIRNGRPTRVMQIEALNAATLGALMMHFMLETIIAAELLGVNAFDQPAVEEGKVLARQYLQDSAS